MVLYFPLFLTHANFKCAVFIAWDEWQRIDYVCVRSFTKSKQVILGFIQEKEIKFPHPGIGCGVRLGVEWQVTRLSLQVLATRGQERRAHPFLSARLGRAGGSSRSSLQQQAAGRAGLQRRQANTGRWQQQVLIIMMTTQRASYGCQIYHFTWVQGAHLILIPGDTACNL